ncbi:zinc transport system permease protein [Nitrospirillum amazonense]|uniref:High-affinity zinc uptake system membrane protein ZnuB n=1 Tax=Nitrospirillum amazonense TaxID=28077 RepID=A0A560FLQ0_9PROT|nr:zinc ABC transporter permease subunit ZnuB [Nitrospirillum amazonense]TWB22549.1 zinc transport system permease protein [Nitrospirillum amazonense]
MDDFLLRALAGGIGVALVAGPLGCFVVWRRMAYFGDTLSHAALLGIALGFVAGINLMLAVALVGLALAGVLVLMQRQRKLATDTLLGLLSHTTLSLGLIAVALLQTVRVDLMSYLFGDILAVSGGDLAWIWGGGAVVLVLLAWLWRPLLAMTVNEDLARVEGVPVLATQLGFMMLMAATIALAMKVVGVLLITALLIIPAACARRFARTPEIMAGLAAAIGALSVCGGLGASFRADLPAGPAVVVAAAALFLLSQLFPRGGTR